MPRIKDQAICIRDHDWSETSQVVTLVTAEHGKVRGLAKGSRRTSPSQVARFCGGIDLLTLGQVVGSLRPHTELMAITEWDLQRPWRHFHTDLEAHRLGLYVADITNALLPEHDAHPAAFAALVRVLEQLADGQAHATALLDYQWQLLGECGYRPELAVDVRSGAALAAEQAGGLSFDPIQGGLTLEPAPADARGDAGGAGPWRVRGETVDLLRRLARGEGRPGDAGPPAAPATPAVARANRLLCAYIRSLLDRELPTMAFILGA